MKRHVVVIGCGAVGAACAVELLRAGHSVTVIEPGTPGGDQSAGYGNAGWLSCQSVIPSSTPGMWKKVPGYLMDPLGPLAIRWSFLPRAMPWLLRYLHAGSTFDRIQRTAAALAPLLENTVELHAALAKDAGVAHLIAAGGVAHAYPNRAAFDAEKRLWQIRASVGIQRRELEGEALRAELPALPERYAFAVAIDAAGRCLNPGAYIAALADLARARGAAFVSAAARDFRFQGDRLSAVVTDQGEVACDMAVIAAGARSAALTARLRDRKPLATERGYHVMVEGASLGLNSSFMVSDGKVVVHELETGIRVAGQVEIAGVDDAPDWRRAEILKRHLTNLFPHLDVGGAKYWLGHRPAMPDGKPCLGRARGTSDVIYAFGHGHVGLVAAPRTGRIVAALVDGRPPEINIDSFDPGRFRPLL